MYPRPPAAGHCLFTIIVSCHTEVQFGNTGKASIRLSGHPGQADRVGQVAMRRTALDGASPGIFSRHATGSTTSAIAAGARPMSQSTGGCCRGGRRAAHRAPGATARSKRGAERRRRNDAEDTIPGTSGCHTHPPRPSAAGLASIWFARPRQDAGSGRRKVPVRLRAVSRRRPPWVRGWPHARHAAFRCIYIFHSIRSVRFVGALLCYSRNHPRNGSLCAQIHTRRRLLPVRSRRGRLWDDRQRRAKLVEATER